MNVPIENQLRDLFQAVDDAQGAVDLNRLQHLADTSSSTLATTINTQKEFTMHDPGDTGSTTRIGHLLLAAATVVAVLAGLAYVASRSDDDSSTAGRTDATDVVESARADAKPLPPPDIDSDLDGRYQTDLLGLPMTFATSEMSLVRSQPGELRLVPQGLGLSDPREDFTRQAVVFLRLGGWKTSEEAGSGPLTDVGSIDPNDIEAWIADNDVIVDRRPAKLVGGYAASVYDVRVDPTSDNDFCEEDARPCIAYYAISDGMEQTRGLLYTQIDATHTDRFWLVTIEDEDPILIVAIAGIGNEAWLDEFEATTIASLELGDDAVPLTAVEEE